MVPGDYGRFHLNIPPSRADVARRLLPWLSSRAASMYFDFFRPTFRLGTSRVLGRNNLSAFWAAVCVDSLAVQRSYYELRPPLFISVRTRVCSHQYLPRHLGTGQRIIL